MNAKFWMVMAAVDFGAVVVVVDPGAAVVVGDDGARVVEGLVPADERRVVDVPAAAGGIVVPGAAVEEVLGPGAVDTVDVVVASLAVLLLSPPDPQAPTSSTTVASATAS